MRINNLTLTGLLCGCLMLASPALASDIAFPPPQQFTNNGTISGTLQTQGMTLPITGTLDYLTSGGLQQIKIHVSVDSGGQQITSDLWETITSTVINEWEIVSTDPTTCRKEVLSGHSYPQCTAWSNPSPNNWSQECAVTAQGDKGTLDISAVLSGNLLVKLNENPTISGATDSLNIIIDSQRSSPPDASVFLLPSICNAPNRNNQGENDNSQGNEEGQCTSTIPSICL